ncbi:MAG: 4-hydroxythreonine-4-phosphate dehydrogenase PdxA [Candidatus Melainabacteria bacterium]|nr:4-hydroxythreonine-4-phosphate dehydrogenase PdxA [Candidatus Melainabacteria bacterium]
MVKEKYVGITYGDPAGIGPEILCKTLGEWKKRKFKPTPLIIDESDVLPKCKKQKPSKHSGLIAYRCLKQAISLAKDKKMSALITGPVSKKLINLSKSKFKGQTEEIAKSCKIHPDKVIMLFVAGDFKIALFTRHVALKDVSKKITKKKLLSFLLLLNKELKKWFHIKYPKIAILGLNPHASEDGMFGKEEKKIITPVINKLKSFGLNLFGPLSPDGTLAQAGQNYLHNKRQKYNVYVSFYHDQALPLFKAVCGFCGVNVTLGAPFLRVSPCHGTAFDIAFKSKASNLSLVSAIKLAEKLIIRPKTKDHRP